MVLGAFLLPMIMTLRVDSNLFLFNLEMNKIKRFLVFALSSFCFFRWLPGSHRSSPSANFRRRNRREEIRRVVQILARRSKNNPAPRIDHPALWGAEREGGWGGGVGCCVFFVAQKDGMSIWNPPRRRYMYKSYFLRNIQYVYRIFYFANNTCRLHLFLQNMFFHMQALVIHFQSTQNEKDIGEVGLSFIVWSSKWWVSLFFGFQKHSHCCCAKTACAK